MKALIFDAGPIISLTTNNLLWMLEPLKKLFKGKFYVSSCVQKELIQRPLTTKKFKFEALQVEAQVEKGVLEIISHDAVSELANELYGLANSVVRAQGKQVIILQMGEVETLAATVILNASAAVIDEKVTRLLLEDSGVLKKIMQQRLHTAVQLESHVLKLLLERISHVSILRSTELALVAFENGLLDQYVVQFKDAKKTLLESILWGLKLNGCSISENEINILLQTFKYK